jgi:hypothetical protein
LKRVDLRLSQRPTSRELTGIHVVRIEWRFVADLGSSRAGLVPRIEDRRKDRTAPRPATTTSIRFSRRSAPTPHGPGGASPFELLRTRIEPSGLWTTSVRSQ